MEILEQAVKEVNWRIVVLYPAEIVAGVGALGGTR